MDLFSGVGNILGGFGGGAGIGKMICGINGNCPPESVTYVNQSPERQGDNTLLYLILAGGLVAVVIYFIKK